ncbi:hypothetical protein [Bifidobacterium choloepi]|uniref:Thymidine phosphorylase n=1 Tax=Bifidobacterium choloepi TaxID=2614131 RepID=A0A6I5NHP6_9BIFI|nr:hypothetical protein [Bifidobacterium choloepi]NEG69843.1 hypothetical protein [Bifidobacterium choloepi]
MHFGSGSIVSSGSGFTHTGSPRPSRPGQLDQAIADNIVGGLDPEYVTEMSHATAAALLDHVHSTADPAVVERVLTIVDREGVDVIAELWSHAEPDSLPGVLWRLYCLRSWVRLHREAVTRLWRLGEPMVTSASAVAGVDSAPTEDDLVRTADSILRGAFRGDFAMALDRAAAFVEVIVLGLRIQARRLTSRAAIAEHDGDLRTKAARLLHTAGNLTQTAKDLRGGAHLWRIGKLE